MISSNDIKLSLVSQKDKLFESGPFPVPFEFNSDVVEVFDDMVSRSVPMYEEVNRLLIQWAYLFHQPNTNIYDIGCSTGTMIKALATHLPYPAKFFGIDSSAPMLEKASQKLEEIGHRHSLILSNNDANAVEYENASFSVINYTLQFLPLSKRKALLNKIFQGTLSGGILFLSEKVRSNDPFFQDAMTRIYEDYKHRAGYSKNEIERKKEALDRVLVPSTHKELESMLFEAGFNDIETVIRFNNFVSIVAKRN